PGVALESGQAVARGTAQGTCRHPRRARRCRDTIRSDAVLKQKRRRRRGSARASRRMAAQRARRDLRRDAGIKNPRKRGTKPGAENAPAWGRGNPLREEKRETTCIVCR